MPVSDLCDEYPLSPTLFYAWQKIFFENGASSFERKNGSAEQAHLRTITALREKFQRKNEVVAELMEDVGIGQEVRNFFGPVGAT